MRYRKRPVVIEARQFDGHNALDLSAWINHNGGEAWISARGLAIETLEGTMAATKGDYVIKGVQGEFYPCAADVFALSYEPEAAE